MKASKAILFLAIMAMLTACMNTEKTSSSSDSTSTTNQESTTSNPTTSEKLTIEDCNGTPKSKQYAEIGYEALYNDLNFKQGLRVSKAFYGPGEPPHHSEKITLFEGYNEQPIWGMAQWSSNFDIMIDGYELNKTQDGLVNEIVSNGKLVHGEETPAKILRLNSIDGSMYFESNCQVEYTQDRVPGDPWVHLLMEQSFGNNADELVFIKDLESLVVEANYKITKFEDVMGENANPSVHAAQMVWFITIQNRNKDSKGYGKYIWFGIPLWDNRQAGKPSNVYSAHDKGTDTLIYSMASSSYLNKTYGNIPNVGEDATARADILSIIQTAFNDAKSKGYLTDTEYTDLAIGGTNFGFEMPGTYNIGAQVDDIGVYYLKK